MTTALADSPTLQNSTAVRKARAALARQQQAPLAVEDIDIAAPRDDEILVRMVATGICHTDVVCANGFPVPMPIVLGHEGAGVIEAVGAAVHDLAVGDHVLLSFNSCGVCPNCRSHDPAYCHQFMGLNFGGVRLEDGSSPLSQHGEKLHGQFFGQSSFATLAIARSLNAVKVDKSLPLDVLAPLGCGIQTGAGAVMNSLKVRTGRSLAVFGCGAVGLSAVMAAMVVGAAPVVVVEPSAERRALALELGAAHAIDPTQTEDVAAALRAASGGGGFDYALDTSGIPAVMKTAVDVLLPNGMLGLIGIPPPDAPMPMSIMEIYVRGLGVKCIVEGDAEPKVFIPKLVELYRAGKLPVDKLIRTYPFEKINEAFAAAAGGSVVKPVVTF
jgi:aryl-alcohol dehydrogenase/geraniol dehydrogenase (NAD+)